jgi:hypothetical protein
MLHTTWYSFDNIIVPAVNEREGKFGKQHRKKKACLENMLAPNSSIRV